MPKSKKRKTTHHHHSSTNGELTHAEIWDDSALIRAWNDAAAEYEYYHSIHARGEDVDEVLRQAEEAEQADKAAQNGHDNKSPDGEDANEHQDVEDGEIDEDEQLAAPTELPSRDVKSTVSDHVSQPSLAAGIASKSVDQPVMMDETSPKVMPDQAFKQSDTVQSTAMSDQTLENVKMAYYWAGYYSGLYDGQKQGERQTDGPGKTLS